MYDSYFGLSGRPFQLTPDPAFYFESATHRKAMSYLGYGLAQGEGFIVITGEIGAGKSTLVAHLMASINTARLTAAQIVTTQLAGDDLLHMVARAFGIDTSGCDKTATLAAIERFLHDEARAGRRALLVIDESQNLPTSALEELRMLSNFQLGSQPLLQIFLLGQPEFRDMLRRAPTLEQLRQRVIATHHLEAMGAEEVQPYIEHRLAKVGWKGRPSFTADAHAALYAASAGVPRKLNAIAHRLMLMAAVDRHDTIDATLVQAVVTDMAADTGNERVWDDPRPMAEAAPVAAPSAPSAAPFDQAMAHELAALRAELERLADENRALAAEAARGADGHARERAALMERIEMVEARFADQEQTLRRVLTLLVDWVEDDRAFAPRRASAA